MIDRDGFRSNVGIVLINDKNQVFLGRSSKRKDIWQFPQGGMMYRETPTQCMYRELYEEIGLTPKDVEIVSMIKNWIYYRLPEKFVRRSSKRVCIGQKQKWFLLRLKTDDDNIRFDRDVKPEFDDWMWVDYWHPVEKIAPFKRHVYQEALQKFSRFIK